MKLETEYALKSRILINYQPAIIVTIGFVIMGLRMQYAQES